MTMYHCSVTTCPATQEGHKPGLMVAEQIPAGWGTVTLSGYPGQQMLLCSQHFTIVKGDLARLSIRSD